MCREVRPFCSVPILMLTARDTEMDEILALELGVDDFLSKPFSLGVLKARMRLLNGRERQEQIASGDLTVDQIAGKAYRNGDEISLSRLEYRLLLYLMENKNHVLSKEQILSHIWDKDGKYVDPNTLSVNIRRLRAKVEEDASFPKRIKTVHGMGYLWREE